MLRARPLVLICLTAAVLTAGGMIALGASRSTEDELQTARRFFKEKSFGKALTHFRTALVDPAFRDESEAIQLEMGACLRGLGQWAEVLAHYEKLVSEHAGGLTEARGQVRLGEAYMNKPHYRYEKDGKDLGLKSVPGARYRSTEREDYRAADAALEAAHRGYDRVVADTPLPPAVRAGLPAERRSMNVLYVNLLERLQQQAAGWRRGDLDERKRRIAKVRPLHEKAIRLFEENYLAAVLADDAKSAARALYRRGMYLRRYAEKWWARDPETGKAAIAETADQLFDRVLREFPKSSWADDACYARGLIAMRRKAMSSALAHFGRLGKEWPDSRWLGDAREHARRIRRPELTLDVGGLRLPGTEPTINLRTRNIQAVSLTAYRIPLEKYLGNAKALRKIGNAGLSQLAQSLEEIAGRAALRQNVEAKWTHDTPDKGAYRQHRSIVKVPLTAAGAYLIEATSPKCTAAAVLVLSDLAVVRRRGAERSLFFVADARTGKPREGIAIAARQKANDRLAFVDSGRTDADGVWTCANRYSIGRRYHYMEAFAWDDGRYAFTGWAYQYRRSDRASGRTYGFTDRGAYRPGQTVHFAALLRKAGRGTRFENVAGRRVALSIHGPRGKKVHTATAKADEYGMVQGEWKIASEPTLGRYRLMIKSGRSVPTANVYFRVEEYKRPEFEVTIAAERAVRSGEVLTAKIDAAYYFGGAVAGARVKYTIHRRSYRHTFRFEDPFSFLYDRPARLWYGAGSRRRSRRDELVIRGEGVTDADGGLRVKVATAPWVAKYPGEDHRFQIKAEVMDLSRRTIEGSGSVTVAKTQYFAALRPDRAFVAPGETVQVEVRTERADGRAVERSGVLKVVKTQPPHDLPKRRGDSQAGDKRPDEAPPKPEQIMETLPVQTDEHGRAIVEWKAVADGYYVLRFEARDATEAIVRGEAPVWVCGPKWNGRSYRFQDLEILTDRTEYAVGDVARVLINCRADDGAVLLCELAGKRLNGHRVVRLTGRSAVVELPVSKSMVPNAFLDGTAIHDGTVLRAYREMFVPPVDRFLNVDVQFAKPDYEPGEQAEAIVRVTDANGEPHGGRVSFGAVDASLDVIQGDPARDIRRAFYGDRRTRGVGHQDSFQYRSRAATWAHVPIGSHRFKGVPPDWYGSSMTDAQAVNGLGGKWGGDESPVEESEAADDMAPSADAGVAEGKRGVVSARPRAAAKPMAREALSSKKRARRSNDDAADPAPTKVRQNFAETAVFSPAVDLDANGTARVRFTLPDSLTRWRTTVRAYTPDTRVGQKKTAFVTRKRLLVRPQIPRFFRERDRVVVSAIVNSSLPAAAAVTMRIAVGSPILEVLDATERTIEIPAGGEARIDWRIDVRAAGSTTVEIRALSAQASDAVRRTVPVLRYGSERTVAETMAIRSERGEAEITFDVPRDRAPGSSRVEVVLNPSIAGVLLDALPYLIEYPYGCVEQTMSRFLPAVVARATLRRTGVDLEDLAKRMNASASSRAKGLSMKRQPVFDSDELHTIATKGLRRIYGFQGPDGGFGWFPGATSDPYMTAYVLYGLRRAKDAELDVDRNVVKRALDFLARVTEDTENLHRAAYQCFALAVHGRQPPAKAFERVYRERVQLNNYSRAILALAAHRAGKAEWARIVAENLEDYVETDPRTGAASLGSTGQRWCWWSDAVETNAFALMVFNQILPVSKHRDGLVKWLVANRKGRRWRSTKDTAHAILALADYMTATGELTPDYTVDVLLDGEPVRTAKVTRDNLFTFDRRVVIDDARLSDGTHRLTLRKRGAGRLYAAARFSYFSREAEIAATVREFGVKRRYFRVKPIEKRGEDGKLRIDHERELLRAGAAVKAGDEIEVALELDPHHGYDYVMVEDPKPCGFEPVMLRSGSIVTDGLWSYMELRDTRAAFFVPHLPKASSKLSYRLRAEAPGRLNAMPARAQLMYSPEVGGESASWRVVVTDG